MKLTLVSTQIELSKIFTHKKYIVLMLIQLAVCFVSVIFTSANGFALFGIDIDVPAIPYIFLNVLTVSVLPLLVFMLSADVFSNEVENATIRSVLLRPISRLKIYLSKMLAIWLYTIINLLLTLGVIAAVKLAAWSGTADYLKLCTAYALSAVPMLAFVAMAAFIALCINNSSLAMFCAIVVYAVMQGVTIVSAPIGAMFFTSHISWYNMFLGLSIDLPTVLNTLFLFLSYTSLFGLGGYLLFERKEL